MVWQPATVEETTLDLERTFLARTGREATNEEIMKYMQHHRLQEFLTEVIVYVARYVPPDPFEFLLNHMEAIVRKHLAAQSMAWGTVETGPSPPTAPSTPTAHPELPPQQRPPVALPPPLLEQEVTPAQRRRVVRQLAAVLRHPGVLSAAAARLTQGFADSPGADGSENTCFSQAAFHKLLCFLETGWGLHPDDTVLMLSTLKRWRFRTNATASASGAPLWPLSKQDFLSALPCMLRAVRDQYVPIGGKVHRSLFIRKARGELTDRYNVGPKLGRGAFGEVRLVSLQESPDVRRVCKRVARSQQRVASEELSSEVEILRSLDHPHIVRLFEFFETDEWCDMVMEPVFGGTLTRLVKGLYSDESGAPLGRRPEALTESWVAAALLQLLGALAYAHGLGVIHKDLKPDNVLLVGRHDVCPADQLTEPLHLMLADFGIAEVFTELGTQEDILVEEEVTDGELHGVGGSFGGSQGSGSSRRTRSSRVGGTAPYMSPEMFKGSFTEKSDLWSLGVIMFHMLSGDLPYKAENVLMQANMVCNPRRHPPWVMLADYGWSLGCRWFCQRLLCKDEDGRPGAAQAAADDWLVRAARSHAAPVPEAGQRQALCVHHLRSHMMRMAMTAVTSQMSLSQLHELNLRFQQYDTSGDGLLSHDEMRQVLVDMGIPSPDEAASLLLETLDGNRSGRIEYSEFMAGCLDFASDAVKQSLRAAFSLFDLDNSGSITVEELAQVLAEGPNPSTPVAPSPRSDRPVTRQGFGSDTILPDGKTAGEVMAELDKDNSGIVTYAEFEQYLLGEHERAGRTRHSAQRRAGLLPTPRAPAPARDLGRSLDCAA